jgi:hypothetical protein
MCSTEELLSDTVVGSKWVSCHRGLLPLLLTISLSTGSQAGELLTTIC